MPGQFYDKIEKYLDRLEKISGKIQSFSKKVEDQVAKDDTNLYKQLNHSQKNLMIDILEVKKFMVDNAENITNIVYIFSYVGDIIQNALQIYDIISKKKYMGLVLQNFNESYNGNAVKELSELYQQLVDIRKELALESNYILNELYKEIGVLKGNYEKIRALILPILSGPKNKYFIVPLLRYLMSNHDIISGMPEIISKVEQLKDEMLNSGLETLGLEAPKLVSHGDNIIEKLASTIGLFPETNSMNKEALFDYIEGQSSGKVVDRANLIEVYKYIVDKPAFEFQMTQYFSKNSGQNPTVTQILDETSINYYNSIKSLKTPTSGPKNSVVKARWSDGAQYTIIIETIDGENWRALSFRTTSKGEDGKDFSGDKFFIPTVKILPILAETYAMRPILYNDIIEKYFKDRVMKDFIVQIVAEFKKAMPPKRDPESIKNNIFTAIVDLFISKFDVVFKALPFKPRNAISEVEIATILGNALLWENIQDTEYKITQMIKLEKVKNVFYSSLQKKLSSINFPKAFSGPINSEQNKGIIMDHIKDAIKAAILVLDGPPSLLVDYDYSIKDTLVGRPSYV